MLTGGGYPMNPRLLIASAAVLVSSGFVLWLAFHRPDPSGGGARNSPPALAGTPRQAPPTGPLEPGPELADRRQAVPASASRPPQAQADPTQDRPSSTSVHPDDLEPFS